MGALKALQPFLDDTTTPDFLFITSVALQEQMGYITAYNFTWIGYDMEYKLLGTTSWDNRLRSQIFIGFTWSSR